MKPNPLVVLKNFTVPVAMNLYPVKWFAMRDMHPAWTPFTIILEIIRVASNRQHLPNQMRRRHETYLTMIMGKLQRFFLWRRHAEHRDFGPNRAFLPGNPL